MSALDDIRSVCYFSCVSGAEAQAEAEELYRAVLREAADVAHSIGNDLYDDAGNRYAQGAWHVRNKLRSMAEDN